MAIACRVAANLLQRFYDEEATAYAAYLGKYNENEALRERKRACDVPARADPKWRPEDLNGKRVLVIGENFVGDEVLTLGCLEDLRSWCKDIVWRCGAKLQPLAQHSFPEVRFITDEEANGDLDLAIHSWQLIGRFRPSLREFAWTTSGEFTPYLRSERPEADTSSTPRIGLAWHSEGGKPGKSCRIDKIPGWDVFFQTLGERARFVSLQHDVTQGATHAAIQAVERRYGVKIFQDPCVDTLNDLRGVAAQVAGLDYVVTISTTVAHIAGALGVPGWLLLPDDPLPHWEAGKHICAWYPTLVPVRHETPGDWDSAIVRVTQDLKSRLPRPEPQVSSQ